MKRLCRLLVVGLLVTACGVISPDVSAPAATGQATRLVTLTPAAHQPGTDLVTGLSPEDGAVVNTPYVEVKGLAAPETVLTLNDEILVVDQSGTFSIQMPLVEGPNLIQIVASDLDGNEKEFELVVTYDVED